MKEKETTLIEYAAFYGSKQIFKYLYKNQVEITPNLYIYAIHGLDEEIIHFLEENESLKQEEKNIKYIKRLKESIKCHHNYISEYIKSNFLNDDECIKYSNMYGFHYYNFTPIDEFKITTYEIFNYACKYDYYAIVEHFIKTKLIDKDKINISIILVFFYQDKI